MRSNRLVVHSFRHSFRDRLRQAECPIELIDQLGGWSDNRVGTKYGLGYDLRTMVKYMKKVSQILLGLIRLKLNLLYGVEPLVVINITL